ncbi:MAG: NapC/NirT family cytochrome c [Candidatus Acidiferrales bacterium]
MSVAERLGPWLRPIFFLAHNPLTLLGAVLATSSAFTLLGFWLIELTRSDSFHPYTGIVFFLILPAVFVLGLLLVPLGVWIRRRKLRRKGELPESYPAVNLGAPAFRRAAMLVFMLTVANVIIFGTATYRGVEYMDSVQFCGQACHSVMEPQFTAFVGSPHSRVGCVECHIGPGAPWFVRSKLSGVRQVFAVNFNTYSRPIPAPVKALRPARETCEQCHWPQKFHGDKFVVRTRYAEDEANTALTTVLVMKIGGHTWQGKVGIHGRHLDDVERIRYVATDNRRQVIPRITYVDDSGQAVVYDSTDVQVTPEQLAAGEHRTMDCMDCHNRPTHAFELPERAVDNALSAGRIGPTLPFIKQQAVAALRAEYANRDVAKERIASALSDFYRTSYPDVYKSHRAQVEIAIQNVQQIYLRNVFPGMKVTWGTYPNNIGHEDFLGCFRCHDGLHQSKDGRVITQDCTACHGILAMQETNPKVLTDLGLRQ